MRLSNVIFAIALLVCSSARADSNPIRNDTPTQLRDLGANLNVGANFAVNEFGQLQCVSVVGGGGAVSANKLEDVPHASGDAGVFILGVRNDNAATSFSGANGDYTPIGVGTSGEVFVKGMAAAFGSSATKFEDDGSNSGEGITPIAALRADAIASSVSNANDYANIKVDEGGRLIITAAPPGETWQSCGTATAVTSDIAIKAAVASNRIYVTAISCKNTSTTVGPTMDFKDGSTIISVGGITATSATGTLSASFIKVFPIPLRGTVNTAFNFATNTAVTSVTCCATGYISVL